MQKEPKFLVDFMLGRLAKWLRVFGYDTVYLKNESGKNPVLESLKEDRILVTRNMRLSGKPAWKLALIKSDDVSEQLKQLVTELKLDISKKRLFTICSVCNSPIEPVKDKNEIKALVPEYVFNTQNDFSKCSKCNKLYWHGTHMDLLLKDIKKAGITLKD